TRHWLTMRAIFPRLDQASLLSVSESRSEQVAFNLYALNTRLNKIRQLQQHNA
ncbi:bacteriophage antitermination protein Q, partial [Salmonella enterica subsp. enterica serovar Montevideo]|nr:bacteriophage antitermination protein Q [Salmonella enterica subsp. enterica serovar Montevideo]